MKTTILKSMSLLAVASALFIISCKKEEAITPVTNNSSPTSLSGFFTGNEQAAKQIFTINANAFQTVTGVKGTKLYIPANTFKTSTGALASGNIKIELIEVQSKADMILLNKTTTSNGKLLISGGEISIKAFKNENQLTLANNNSGISVQMPSNNPNDYNMILFSGRPTTTGDVNWNLTGLNGPNNVVQPDSLPGGGYYFWVGSDSIPTDDSLGWINVDRFYNNPNNSHITINAPSGFDNTNSRVSVFFNNLYSVAPLEWKTGTNSWGTQSYTTGLPVGEQIKVIFISEVNGQFYSSITPVTISANMSLNITPTKTTSTQLTSDLGNL